MRNALGRFGADTRGNMGMMFALAAPVLILCVAAASNFSNSVTINQKTQAAADAASLAATTAFSQAALAGGASFNSTQEISVAEAVAKQSFAANAPAAALNANNEQFSAVTTYSNGVVTTTVTYSGAPAGLLSGSYGGATTNLAVVAKTSASVTTATANSGTITGSGWIYEDPIIQGANGLTAGIQYCDATGKTWYNLLSDTAFEVNANCFGNQYDAALYQFQIFAGTHKIFVSPQVNVPNAASLGDSAASFPTQVQVWYGGANVDGVSYPATSGQTTLLSDTAEGITVTQMVGAPGRFDSDENFIYIQAPNYNVVIAYDTDGIGMPDIEFLAENAGACGPLGGAWGETTADYISGNWSTYAIASQMTTAPNFSVTCNTTASATTVKIVQ